MIWFSWRQFRSGTLAALVLLAATALLLGITGVHLSHLYADYRSCSGLTCGGALSKVTGSYRHVALIGNALVVLPAVLGLFWGAPLVARELESGTFRLAWTQGISRTRWMASKVAFAGLSTAVVAGALVFAFSWWSIPFDRIDGNRLDPTIFAERGIVPVAYSLFAFALGVAAGAVIRRTLPAIAATLVGFTGVRLLVQFFVRPHLLAPLHKTFALGDGAGVGIGRSGSGALSISVNGAPQLHGAWVTGSKLVDAAGHAPASDFVRNACQAILNLPPQGPQVRPGVKMAAPAQAQQAFDTCIRNVGLHYHEVVAYQPESRFWALQWLESAIFLGLTVALLALAIYWVRRRLA